MSKANVIKLISVILCVAIFVATICVVLFVHDNNKKSALVYDTESGVKLDTDSVHNMPKGLTFVADAETFSDTSVTLTATVLPTTAVNKALDWSIAWAEPDGWASGKTVTDYVGLSANNNVATVTFKKVFDVKAIIMATSKDNPVVKATCNIDCAKRLLSADIVVKTLDMVTWNFNGKSSVSVLPLLPYNVMTGNPWIGLQESANTTVEYKHEYSEGTVNNEVISTDVVIRSSNSFQTQMYGMYSQYDRFAGVKGGELGAINFRNFSYATIVEGLCPHKSTGLPESLTIARYEQLVNVLNSESFPNDFELKVTFDMKYGDNVIIEYKAKFDRASGPFIVSNVDIDNSGIIF